MKKKRTTEFSEFMGFPGCTKGACVFKEDPTKRKKALCRYLFLQQQGALSRSLSIYTHIYNIHIYIPTLMCIYLGTNVSAGGHCDALSLYKYIDIIYIYLCVCVYIHMHIGTTFSSRGALSRSLYMPRRSTRSSARWSSVLRDCRSRYDVYLLYLLYWYKITRTDA
jgi:hypothetical protein